MFHFIFPGQLSNLDTIWYIVCTAINHRSQRWLLDILYFLYCDITNWNVWQGLYLLKWAVPWKEVDIMQFMDIWDCVVRSNTTYLKIQEMFKHLFDSYYFITPEFLTEKKYKTVLIESVVICFEIHPCRYDNIKLCSF